MASIDDLAALIAQHRATLERGFQSELVKLKVTYGNHAIEQALALARQAELRERVSISGQRRRHQRDIAAARRTQQLFQRKDHEPSSQLADTLTPLPRGWR
jgi:hypothetical protein